MTKISIIGAGSVGDATAYYISQKDIVDELVLLDIVSDMAKVKALEISQCAPIHGFNTKVVGSGEYSVIKNSDLIIISVGVGRKQDMKREEMLEAITIVMKSVIEKIVKYSPNAILLVVTDPVDAMAKIVLEVSNFDRKKVIGMGGLVDSTKYRYYTAKEVRCNSSQVEGLVIGGTRNLVIPLTSYTTIKGKRMHDVLSKNQIEKIIQRTRKASLQKSLCGIYSPALTGTCIMQIAESIMKDLNKLISCTVLCEGEYGFDSFATVPCILGRKKLEIKQFYLNDEEKTLLEQSVAHAKEIGSLAMRYV